MSDSRHTRQGFTIVELLIVTVIIAILAAIVIVAYNGISQRARNASRTAAAEQLYKAVHIAAVSAGAGEVGAALEESGDGEWHRSCLGTGLPTISGTPNVCAAYEGDPYAWGIDGFFTFMKTYATIPSMSGFPAVTSTDGDVLYAPYLERGDVNATGVTLPDALIMEYYLEGTNQDCVLRPIVKNNAIANSAINTVSGSGLTECMIFVAYTGLTN